MITRRASFPTDGFQPSTQEKGNARAHSPKDLAINYAWDQLRNAQKALEEGKYSRAAAILDEIGEDPKLEKVVQKVRNKLEPLFAAECKNKPKDQNAAQCGQDQPITFESLKEIVLNKPALDQATLIDEMLFGMTMEEIIRAERQARAHTPASLKDEEVARTIAGLLAEVKRDKPIAENLEKAEQLIEDGRYNRAMEILMGIKDRRFETEVKALFKEINTCLSNF